MLTPMKSLTGPLAAAAAIGLATCVALGQGPGGPGGPGGPPDQPSLPPLPGQPHQGPPPGAGPVPPGPDPLRGLMIEPARIMAEQARLKLSPEQSEYIKKQFQEADARFAGLRWDLAAAVENLAATLHGKEPGPVDETAAAGCLDKVLALEAEIKKLQMTVSIRIRNKLTPEQVALLQSGPPGGNRRPGPPIPPGDREP